MRVGLGLLILVVFIVGAIGYMASREDKSTEVQNLNFSDIEKEVSAGQATLYDVRTPDEYAEGYFMGSKSWPLQDIENGQYPKVDKNSKIYIYCRSGNRSAQAEALLKNAGYTNIINLGGIDAVTAMGGKIVKEQE